MQQRLVYINRWQCQPFVDKHTQSFKSVSTHSRTEIPSPPRPTPTPQISSWFHRLIYLLKNAQPISNFLDLPKKGRVVPKTGKDNLETPPGPK